MGAPVAAAAALASTRTGRRIAIGMLLFLLLAGGMLVTPLIAIPFAVAGAQESTEIENRPAPVANGDWGYPLAGDYFKGRGFGYNPVSGCSYCSTDHKGYDLSQGCGCGVRAGGLASPPAFATPDATAGASYSRLRPARSGRGRGRDLNRRQRVQSTTGCHHQREWSQTTPRP